VQLKFHTSSFFKSSKTIWTKLLLLLTSLVILAIRAERFGSDIATEPSPSRLADAVPDVLIQDAPPIVVAQPRAAVCQHIMHGSKTAEQIRAQEENVKKEVEGKSKWGHREWKGAEEKPKNDRRQ